MTARIKKFRNYHAVILGIFASVLLCEILLRIIPNSTNHYHTRLSYEPRENVGYNLTSDSQATVNLTCSRISGIHINSLGFRDHEWTDDGKPKIALLGDSFMEALQVSDKENTAALLEKIFGMEVMNSGISGFGTVSQYLAFKHLLKKYKPRLVLLFFYRHNDFMNNDCWLDAKTGNFRQQYCPCAMTEGENNITIMETPPDSIEQKQMSWIEKHSNLFRLIKGRFFPDASIETREMMAQYISPWTGHLSNAEKITIEILRLLSKEVTSYGGVLYLINVPDDYQMEGENNDEFIKAKSGWNNIPPGFDLDLPTRKIKSISDSLSIPFLDLTHRFSEYLHSRAELEKCLTFSCNNHWNPLGHFLAAHEVALQILNHDFIQVDSTEKAAWIRELQTRLEMSPRDILSEKSFGEIYNHGVYQGDSKVFENTAILKK